MRKVIIAMALVGILASLEVNASVIAECGAFKCPSEKLLNHMSQM